MELILMRHAATAGNLLRRYIGTTDEPLSPEGRAAAQAVRAPRAELVFVSPLLRCRETAEICFPGAEQIVVPDLRETDFGLFENKSYEDLREVPEYVRWLESGGTLPFPGGESRGEAEARALRGLDFILDTNKKSPAAVVAHGGTIMAIMAARGEPRRGYYDWQLPNCGFIRVRVEGERLVLLPEAAADA